MCEKARIRLRPRSGVGHLELKGSGFFQKTTFTLVSTRGKDCDPKGHVSLRHDFLFWVPGWALPAHANPAAALAGNDAEGDLVRWGQWRQGENGLAGTPVFVALVSSW